MVQKKAKAKSKAQTVASDDSALQAAAKRVMESASQIWLAGLGAFAKAQEEGGKLFEVLVREGQTLEKMTRKITANKVEEVRDAVENTVSSVRDRATDTWDRLEKVFEDRVSRALGRLGFPDRGELRELAQRVDELARAVSALQSGSARTGKPKSAPAKRATGKAKAAGKAESSAPDGQS